MSHRAVWCVQYPHTPQDKDFAFDLSPSTIIRLQLFYVSLLYCRHDDVFFYRGLVFSQSVFYLFAFCLHSSFFLKTLKA